jgi:hypothetical protein
VLSPAALATGSFNSKLAERSRSAGVRVPSGVVLGADSGDSAGVPVAGVGAGVGGRGSVAGVALGVGLAAAGGSDGLHEQRIATTEPKASIMEDALFISEAVFLAGARIQGESKFVVCCC